MNLPQSNVARRYDFLPTKTAKSPRGQILILFLLILVVFLATVLSVASRTVTDIRVTTTSDESNRAYYAAEAGVEEALKRLAGGASVGNITLNFEGLNQTSASTSIESTSDEGLEYAFPDTVAKDDVVQLMLVSDTDGDGDVDDADIGGGSWDGTGFQIYWGATSTVGLNTPAVEVSVVYVDNATPRNFFISKMAFDRVGSSVRDNGFCRSVSSSIKTFEGKTFYFRSQLLNLYDPSGTEGCDPPHLKLISGTHHPVLARFRSLYAPTPIGIEVTDPDNPIPAQGQKIISTGRTVSGVTRKLEVTRLYPALPAIFDYVLFSGGPDPLSK